MITGTLVIIVLIVTVKQYLIDKILTKCYIQERTQGGGWGWG